jgi:hypothetical protein
MKAIIIVWLLIAVLFPLPVQAQQSSIIRITADSLSSYYYDRSCTIPEGYSGKVELYVWMYHPSIALDGAIFALGYPDFVQPEDTFFVNNSIVMGYLGDLENGIEVGVECISGWNWLVRQTIWITANDYSTIDIVPHSNPDFNGAVLCIGCAGGQYQFDYVSPFQLNVGSEPCYEPTDLSVGIENCSWGAIKSLIR